MGAGQSAPTGSDTKHVFTAPSPVSFNFSPELVDSLSSSSETNSTRAKTLDLHIQQRVSEELAKLLNNEDNKLADARKRVEQKTGSEETDKKDGKSKSGTLKSLVPGSSSGKEEQEKKAQTSKKVADEIEKLKTQLAQRKRLKELPKEVEQAREGVISCLRVNDRRPLDCWKEVEVFKREVGRLEEEFVKKIL